MLMAVPRINVPVVANRRIGQGPLPIVGQPEKEGAGVQRRKTGSNDGSNGGQQ